MNLIHPPGCRVEGGEVSKGVSAKEVFDVATFCVDALRARIAELETRLAAAEKVVEEAEESDVTEDEAKTKWCPYARIPTNVISNTDEVRILMGVLTINRDDSIPKQALCLASGCMAWRWHGSKFYNPPEGYCGLAGQP